MYYIAICSLIVLSEKKKTTGTLKPPVQFSSVAQSCLTPFDPMDYSTQVFPVHRQLRSLLKLMSIEQVPSNHLNLCCPLLLPPSIIPTIRVFSDESFLPIRWPKYWRFSFSINPSNSGLICSRMDWLDLLAVQGTLKSLLQHHSQKHQFFGVQFSLQSNSHIQT